jgi:hypothetical protein
MEAIMEGRGFIAIDVSIDPATLFSEPSLRALLTGLIDVSAEDSNAEAVAARIAAQASKDRVIEMARALQRGGGVLRDDVAECREDVYVPVPGPYAADIGLKWICDTDSSSKQPAQQQFELKYNRDACVMPVSASSSGATADPKPALFEKLVTPVESFRDSTGAIDANACLCWAAAEMSKRRLDHLARAITDLTVAPSERERAAGITAASFKLAKVATPLVVVAKPRARVRHVGLYRKAADTYKIEATYIRMTTLIPQAGQQSPVACPPRFYFSVCFENDNSPRFNLRIVERRMARIAQRWQALAELSGGDSKSRYFFDGYPKMVSHQLHEDVQLKHRSPATSSIASKL